MGLGLVVAEPEANSKRHFFHGAEVIIFGSRNMCMSKKTALISPCMRTAAWMATVTVSALAFSGSSAFAATISFTVDQLISASSTPASVKITLDDETQAGSIKVTAEVLDPEADIRGIFFHVNDESLLSGMLDPQGDDVADWEFSANNVSNLGGGANLNGGEDNPGPFDGGVQIGTPGAGKDDINMTMFFLAHESESLDLSLFSDQVFGVRLTSVGPAGGRNGSSKLYGMVPEPSSFVLMLTGLAVTLMPSSRSRRRRVRK